MFNAHPLQGRKPFPLYIKFEPICCVSGLKVGLNKADQ